MVDCDLLDGDNTPKRALALHGKFRARLGSEISKLCTSNCKIAQHMLQNVQIDKLCATLLPGLTCGHTAFLCARGSVRHSNPTSTFHCANTRCYE